MTKNSYSSTMSIHWNKNKCAVNNSSTSKCHQNFLFVSYADHSYFVITKFN